ncbi:hypothetical protein B0T10DRAFT_166939 [Thelonectria olida]|uniref:Uncharacterized protein n=1 Tax=Thelonectria olida TaxID=1576542 RepID=A0A9P9AU14_9HYPO|nr:hypothetical protein B0T10DRAFT_166939 [Thelonectria olida]
MQVIRRWGSWGRGKRKERNASRAQSRVGCVCVGSSLSILLAHLPRDVVSLLCSLPRAAHRCLCRDQALEQDSTFSLCLSSPIGCRERPAILHVTPCVRERRVCVLVDTRHAAQCIPVWGVWSVLTGSCNVIHASCESGPDECFRLGNHQKQNKKKIGGRQRT